MTLAIVHSLLAAAACYGLWRLWRRWLGGADARVQRIVGAGLVARALAGEALFWISDLGLPIGRSLQLGDGLWFFGLDGAGYMAYANEMLERGIVATLTIGTHYPSRAYIQLLTALFAAFGSYGSVALLLNLAAYLATCALLLRIHPHVNGAMLFALSAVAFGPAMLLWSLQPLKDTAFECLVAALLFCFQQWQQRPRIVLGAAMTLLVYELATLRWYSMVILLCASVVFFLLAHRGRALLAGAALFLVLTQAVRLGGRGDMNPAIVRYLDPQTAIAALRGPQQVTPVLNKVRGGFERQHGGTTIAPGRAGAEKAAPAAAALVPRAVGQPLGLFEVGGGRGLWLFAEIDTLALDAVLVFALAYCVRARRRVTPLFVLVLLVFLATAGPMLYTVTNFGTLLRLRGMLYFLAAALPLTLAPETPA